MPPEALVGALLIDVSPLFIVSGISVPLFHRGAHQEAAAEWRATPRDSRAAASFADPVR